jgi:hypothetical protein
MKKNKPNKNKYQIKEQNGMFEVMIWGYDWKCIYLKSFVSFKDAIKQVEKL